MIGRIGSAGIAHLSSVSCLFSAPRSSLRPAVSSEKVLREFKKTPEDRKGRNEEETKAPEERAIRKAIQGVDGLKSKATRSADKIPKDAGE